LQQLCVSASFSISATLSRLFAASATVSLGMYLDSAYEIV
jgi:hypothetical protein